MGVTGLKSGGGCRRGGRAGGGRDGVFGGGNRQLVLGRDGEVALNVGARLERGQPLVEAVTSSAFDAGDHFGWVASDNRTTRGIAKVLREDYAIPRRSIKAQAYWVA